MPRHSFLVRLLQLVVEQREMPKANFKLLLQEEFDRVSFSHCKCFSETTVVDRPCHETPCALRTPARRAPHLPSKSFRHEYSGRLLNAIQFPLLRTVRMPSVRTAHIFFFVFCFVLYLQQHQREFGSLGA